MQVSKEKNFISAVVYVHNDESTLNSFLNTIILILKNNFEKYEIICVNDASNDRSSEVIKNISRSMVQTTITVVNMSFYQGIDPAMNAGVDLAIGDFVFEFDRTEIDYQDELVMNVYRHSLTGYDIVSAAPKQVKRISSKLFYSVFNNHSSNVYMLSTENFRILSRRAINRVDSISKTIPYRKAIYATCGLKIDTIEYDNISTNNKKIERKINANRKIIAFESFILFTNVANKISLILAILMAVFALGSGIYTIFIYFGKNQPVEGWAPIMGLVSVGLFGIFLILTIIIKYLDLILKLVFKKQKYLVSSIEKLK